MARPGSDYTRAPPFAVHQDLKSCIPEFGRDPLAVVPPKIQPASQRRALLWATRLMPNSTPEQRARQQIDAQLVDCGWVVQDYKAVDFSAGREVALREVPLTTGPCDYLLLVDRRAVGVIEAKKVGTTLSTVAEQTTRYARSLPDFLAAGVTGLLPITYESTGVETFFCDRRDPDARSRRVFAFHRPETLAEWATEESTLRARLQVMPTEHQLATSGMRDCRPAPHFTEHRRCVPGHDLHDSAALFYLAR